MNAIFAEEDAPQDRADFVALNVMLANGWKPIVVKKAAAPDADAWADVKDKRALLER